MARKYRRGRSSNNTGGLLFIILLIGVGAFVATIPRETWVLIGLLLSLIALAVLTGVMLFAYLKHRKARAIRISGVDAMDGWVFEKYVVRLLKSRGFKQVTITEKYDLGIDIIAVKDGEQWGIQVKRNKGKTKALSVRQVITAMNHYKCTRAMVVSNSFYTGAAKQLAKANDCVLINRDELSRWILDFQKSGK